MRSLDSDTDDEYLDDPIKLFDLEQERVHFGSQMQQHDVTSYSAFSQLTDNVTQASETELVESSDDDLNDFSDIECLPVSVKLVDCAKFPWYFKKYTKQIVCIQDSIDLVSDSDDEIDENIVRDGCFISDEITNNNNASLFVKTPKVTSKTSAAKRQETYRRREDIELQLALNRKSLVKADYKRNIGLIGMIITQKIVKGIDTDTTIYHTNKERDVQIEQNKLIADTSYMSAVKETLSNCDTELTEDIEIAVDTKALECKNIYDHAETKKDEVKELNKVCVQFSLDKISKPLLHNIITNKTPNNKQKDNVPNKSIFTQEWPGFKIKCSSNNVINITKTNKYKKRQIKIRENMLFKIKAAAKKLQKDRNDLVSSEVTDDLDQIPPVKDNPEPHSPILPCSTLKKNRELGDVKEDKISAHGTSMNVGGDSHQKEYKQKSSGNSIGNVIRSDLVNEAINKKDLVYAQPALQCDSQTNSLILQHKNKDVQQIKEERMINNKALDENNKNSDLTEPFSNHITKTFDSVTPTFAVISQEKKQLQTVSIVSLAKPNKLNNISDATVEKTAPSLDIDASQSKRISVITSSNGTAPLINDFKFNPYMPSSAINNDTYKNDAINPVNNNKLVHNTSNPYASAINLKPNQPNNVQSTRFSQPIFNRQHSSRMSTPVQSRSYPSYLCANYYSPSYSYNGQKFAPRFSSAAIPNYRFPSPYENRCQPKYDSILIPPYSWRQPNIYNKNASKSSWPRKNDPFRFPMTVSQRPQSAMNRNDDIVPRPENVFPSDSCTVIGKNKDNSVKDNLVLRSLLSQNNEQTVKLNNRNSEPSKDKSEIVNSKIEMAEVLEKAVNNLKRVIDNDETEVKKNSVKEVKRPRLFISQPTANENKNKKVIDNYATEKKRDPAKESKIPSLSVSQPIPIDYSHHQQQIEHQKGYSPPILPIPIYENIMGHVGSVLHKQEGLMKKNCSSNTKYTNTCAKRAPGYKIHKSSKREDAKKISLEEYKKRSLKRDNKNETYYKQVRRYNNDYGRNQLNKLRENVDRFRTDSDLGYNSDSTVVLERTGGND